MPADRNISEQNRKLLEALLRRNRKQRPAIAAAPPESPLNQAFFRKSSKGHEPGLRDSCEQSDSEAEDGAAAQEVPAEPSADTAPDITPLAIARKQSVEPERSISPLPKDLELESTSELDKPIRRPRARKPNDEDPSGWATAWPLDRSVATALQAYRSLEASADDFDFPLAPLKSFLDEVEARWEELGQLQQDRQTRALRFASLQIVLSEDPTPELIAERNALRCELLSLGRQVQMKLDDNAISIAILSIEERIAEEGQFLVWNEPTAYLQAKVEWTQWREKFQFTVPENVNLAYADLITRLKELTATLEAGIAGDQAAELLDSALVALWRASQTELSRRRLELEKAGVSQPVRVLRRGQGLLVHSLLEWRDRLVASRGQEQSLDDELACAEAESGHISGQLAELQQQMDRLSRGPASSEETSLRAFQQDCSETEAGAMQLLALVQGQFPEHWRHPALPLPDHAMLNRPLHRFAHYSQRELIQTEPRRAWRAYWNNRPVVLKRYELSEKETVLHEVLVLRQLASPHVVEVSGVIVDETDAIYIEMPMCNETLAQRLNRAPLDDQELVSLSRELIQAVQHLQNNQSSLIPEVTHGDLSLNNIFLLDGHIKLGDFDLSNSSSARLVLLRQRLLAQFEPKPAHAQIQTDSVVSLLTPDVFCVCGVIYDLLVPWQINQPRDLFSAGLSQSEIRTQIQGIIRSLESMPLKIENVLQHPLFKAEIPAHAKNCPLYWTPLGPSYHASRVDVTARLGREVQELMDSSSIWVHETDLSRLRLGWAADHPRIVHGADNRGIEHLGFQVVKVERIENRKLWLQYASRRAYLTAQLSTEAGIDRPRLASAADWQRDLLGGETANEVFLFHGTKAAALDAILLEGLDPRVSHPGLFGHGLYFAENASKSDEYTGEPTDGLHLMFLSRVVLGRPYIHKGMVGPSLCDAFPKEIYWPQIGHAGRTLVQDRKDGPADKSLSALLRGPYLADYSREADSLWHQRGGRSRPWKHAEFVIYDKYQVYPEFLITYRRRKS